MKVVLTIAGSDPSGGAGIQADLKVFERFGVYGAAVISLVTVQNTLGVQQVQPLTARLVRAQLEAVLEDFEVAAIKTGALGTRENVEAVADVLATAGVPILVVDPIAGATRGVGLDAGQAFAAIEERLLPLATLLTPNLPEAMALCRRQLVTVADMEQAARDLCDVGARAVLVKGGHLQGDKLTDVLHVRRGMTSQFSGGRIDTRATHGTGCTLSAAIAANLALGLTLPNACGHAIGYLRQAMAQAPGLGHGRGPLRHSARTG